MTSRTAVHGIATFNQSVIDEFRRFRGRPPGAHGGRLLLLTTTGARTREPRTVPLVYTRDGERYVVAASKGGAPRNPDWFHNLRANPMASVEVVDEEFLALCRVVSGAERERLFTLHAASMPMFNEYQRSTVRTIPVVVIERR